MPVLFAMNRLEMGGLYIWKSKLDRLASQRRVGLKCADFLPNFGAAQQNPAREKEASMARTRWTLPVLAVGIYVLLTGITNAEPYELTKHEQLDPNKVKSTEISLFGVKLGDPEAKAIDLLINEKIPGVKAEQEATFLLLLDQRKPTGPMAGVRLMDGKVDLIFINNRFAYKTRGIFRNVLNSESPEEIRKLLGKEDSGDENVMGAVLNYVKQGFLVNYLGKDVNVEFTLPQ
jgi:hypothetical protein